VRAAFLSVDVVGVCEDVLLECLVVLQRDLDGRQFLVLIALAGKKTTL